MSFLYPLRLVLLILPAALAVFAVMRATKRSKDAVTFAQVELLDHIAPTKPLRRVLPALLVVLGLTLSILGLAHPQRASLAPDKSKVVVLTFDTSGSMNATDVHPSRIAAARAAAVAFIKAAPPDVKIGFVQFASTVKSTQSPTLDHAALINAINHTTVGGGTAIGDSIVTALGMIAPPGSPVHGHGAIIVLSDGSTNQGVTDAYASTQAKTAGVRVSTIAFGTQGGVLNTGGVSEPVPSSPASLAAISQATGGKAMIATSATQLNSLFENLSTTVASVTVHHDYGDLLIFLGLLCLLTASTLTLLWFARIN